MTRADPATGGVPVDAHVHLHPEHSLARVYARAARRFARVAPGTRGVLMLTQTTRAREALTSLADEPRGWAFEPLEPGLSGLARHPDRGEVFVVQGLQIVTRDRLEVLGLAMSVPVFDHLDTRETIEAVLAGDGFPVLPWGVGKWWGERGKLIGDLVRNARHGDLALGDNAGRPWGWPRPRQFRLAEERGIPVLPGSDPLAIPGHQTRPAKYGLLANLTLDPVAPAASLRAWLKGISASPEPFGRRTDPVSFVLDQASIRARKAANLGGVA
ncbi:MAG: hypothetical protein ACF8Q5_01855 [Phycisphaerales bacterium JB040]